MPKVMLFGDVKVFGAPVTICKDLKEMCGEADLVIANLEGPIIDRVETKRSAKSTGYSSDMNVAALLSDLSVDVVLLGNNHICDYGLSGLRETIEICAELGISWVGAKEPNDHCRYLYVNDQLKLCVFSFAHHEGPMAGDVVDSYGPCPIPEMYKLVDEIKKLKALGYQVIVAYHGGEEYFSVPWPRRLGWLKIIADAGANVVFGSHSHSTQPVYVTDTGNYIASGIGNTFFLTPRQKKNINGTKGLMLEYDVDAGSLVAHTLQSCFETNHLRLVKGKSIKPELLNVKSIYPLWQNEAVKYIKGQLARNVEVGRPKGLPDMFRGVYKYARFVALLILNKAGGVRDWDIFLASIPLAGRVWAKLTYNFGKKRFRY